MTDKSYNGWTNRATWALNLWFNNNQGLYEYMQEEISSCVEQEYSYEQAYNHMMEFFQNYIEEQTEKVYEVNPMMVDFLVCAEIDYDDVVESVLNDYEEKLAEAA